ncbi:tRNA preQ1(34) S-adenosylmethionine ribosyltransferase-isomerase QueA [Candidatus Omnitrophota bacterium]
MKLTDFNYSLPQDLIAQLPLRKRDASRLLVLDRKSQKITHAHFRDIGNYLSPSDCLILNNTRVIPARLLGKRATGGKVEVFLLKRLSDGYSYTALIKPLKRLNLNEKIFFNNGTITAALKDPLKKIVRFNVKSLSRLLEIGQTPLPPYIKRAPQRIDATHYQTVYAKRNGSVASPTAGLHFTTRLLNDLKKSGITIGYVTLHVNYATFNPVKEDDIIQHTMHSEEFSIKADMIQKIRDKKKSGKNIVAVGTTSTRVLESVADSILAARTPKDITSNTDLFIYPGFKFKIVDRLITNFHLPRSTLFMLVCAFAGRDLVMKAYREAIKKEYRFYSYGDAMIIL